MEEQTSVYNSIPYGPGREGWSSALSKIAVSSNGELLVSAPDADPLKQNIAVPEGITPSLYQVPSFGLSRVQHAEAMEETMRVVKKGSEFLLGFMSSQAFSQCSEPTIYDQMINNAGDPFKEGTVISLQSKWMERSVLDYYASLWNAKWPHDPADEETYWGYVLTMGSSEGNLHSLWSAWNYLTGKYVTGGGQGTPTESKVPVVFFSKYSNFSLHKLCDIAQIPTFDLVGKDLYPNENPLGGEWSPGVPCMGGDAGSGVVDIDSLEILVDFFSSKGHPIVVVFNCGTTFKGACDDVQQAGERLVSVLRKNGMYERKLFDPNNSSSDCARKGFWFHVDGALGASYVPFLEMACKSNLIDVEPPACFDFRLPFISSIVTSSHKFIGTPWPSGVYIVRHQKLVRSWNNTYTGSADKTVGLSRNGHSVVLLWSHISLNSYNDQVSTVVNCLSTAQYALKCLKDLEKELNHGLMISYHFPSLSVIFRRPSLRIVQKYSLSCNTIEVDGKTTHVSQIYSMKHVTRAKIDTFIKDLQAPDAFE